MRLYGILLVSMWILFPVLGCQAPATSHHLHDSSKSSLEGDNCTLEHRLSILEKKVARLEELHKSVILLGQEAKDKHRHEGHP